MTDGASNRRRRRAHRPAGPPTDEASPPTAETPAAATPSTAEPRKPRSRTNRRNEDRGWRDLVGNSPSQLGVSGALRARDVARPDAADLAAADELPVVRRQWTPPAES